MALRGQHFELDLDADNFTAKLVQDDAPSENNQPDIIREIKERVPIGIPVAPKFKATATGFPEHKKNSKLSTFRQRQNPREQPPRLQFPDSSAVNTSVANLSQVPPSDRAIAHHVGKKYGYDFEAKQKAEISSDNKGRIAKMSQEDIEEARAELMGNLNPAFIERLLRRANIDDEPQVQPEEQLEDWKKDTKPPAEGDGYASALVHPHELGSNSHSDPVPTTQLNAAASIHFPVPPRSAASFVPLDSNDPNFLEDLRTHYFPEMPHDPSSLSWLQDPSTEENEESLYNPAKDSYPTSSLRFSFAGNLIPPSESLEIDVSKGLHHHGLAPSSAGYTIPELAILSRSTLPNQRSIAFQLLGRILYRLGRGFYGPRGSDLQEGLWALIEHERVVEIIMREANRTGGHLSSKAYATEALWLWRKGGGGDRGILKEGETIAK